jgi:hypothetical protein
MDNKTIPINIPLIDSLSLKIPFSDCYIIDLRITSLTSTYYETLNTHDEDLNPPKPLVISNNGITIRIQLISIPEFNKITSSNDIVQYISLTISSKLLCEEYFQGITSRSIEKIYNFFMSLEVFQCSFQTFLNSKVSDIDICLNRYIETPLLFSNTLDSLLQQVGTKRKFVYKTNEVENIGLSFNERRRAKPSTPFIKFYHKYFELVTHSAEFYNLYLFKDYAQQIKNLTRVEATIRNYQHRKRLEKYNILSKFNTLNELLQIPQIELFNFICFSLNSYIEHKPRIKSPNLSPLEHIIFEMMQNQYFKGYDLNDLLTIADTFQGNSKASTDVTRTRIRNKIKEIDNIILKNDVSGHIKKIISKNEKINDYLIIFQLQCFSTKAHL